MILPERVLGSSGTTSTRLGLAMGPMFLPTCCRSSSSTSATSRSAAAASSVSRTNATTASPVVSSFAPTTADSATDGCATREDSISVVDRRWPETFMTSSTRPSSQMSPSSS